MEIKIDTTKPIETELKRIMNDLNEIFGINTTEKIDYYPEYTMYLPLENMVHSWAGRSQYMPCGLILQDGTFVKLEEEYVESIMGSMYSDNGNPHDNYKEIRPKQLFEEISKGYDVKYIVIENYSNFNNNHYHNLDVYAPVEKKLILN